MSQLDTLRTLDDDFEALAMQAQDALDTITEARQAIADALASMETA